MKNEAECKAALKRSIKKQGGVAYSLNSSFHTGLPDLYIQLPGRIGIVVEAKYFKDVTPQFCKKIPYSMIQRYTLEEVNRVQKGAAWGAMFIKSNRDYFLFFVPPDVISVSYIYSELYPVAKYNKSLKIFELDNFLEKCKIPFVYKDEKS